MTWEPPSPLASHHNDANCGQFQFVKAPLAIVINYFVPGIIKALSDPLPVIKAF